MDDGPGRRTRILVAEDDEAMRTLVVEALAADGHDVEEAVDGHSAFARLSRSSPPLETIDLVVSDIRMPGMTGLQILEMLRAQKRPLPVILMSGFGDGDAREHAHQRDALFLDKPFSMLELRQFVARALGR